jgi:hypothetical protein
MLRPKVMVLGAGASRAALVPEGVHPECKPPLNADFFTQLQRITESKHKTAIEAVVADVVDLFGSNFSLTLEDYFTQLEFLARTINIVSQQPDFRSQEIAGRLKNLMTALAAVLEASTNDILKTDGCARHLALAESLEPGDTIVSFNYDCLIDDALRREGDNIWSARWGYGFPRSGYELIGAEHWDPDVPASRENSVRLLKLHGSLNWQLPEGEKRIIKLKQRLHQQHGVPKFTIVPPVWNKAVDAHDIFRRIWALAAGRLRRARVICVIGFSFVPTDLYAQSLFRLALGEKSRLRRLVIANPDGEARLRIRRVFDVPLLGTGVLLRQYDKLEDLVQALPDAFN